MMSWPFNQPEKILGLHSGLQGHLLGLPLAVIAFNCWRDFLQAMPCRKLFVLVALYFHDASFQDVASAKGSRQAARRLRREAPAFVS